MRHRTLAGWQIGLLALIWIAAIAAGLLLSQRLAPSDQHGFAYLIRVAGPVAIAFVATLFVTVSPRGPVKALETPAPEDFSVVTGRVLTAGGVERPFRGVVPTVFAGTGLAVEETAALALGASLTGHLVIGSFHAASSASAISRLADMGIEPYVLRSGVLGILSQRLVRQLCACSREIRLEEEKLGLDIRRARAPVGCDACQQSGYQGRMLIAELLTPGEGSLARAILSGPARAPEALGALSPPHCDRGLA